MAGMLTSISTRHRVAAPAYLSKPVRAVFEALVSSVDTDHFTPADLPLLAEYATAAVTAQKASEMLEQEGHVVGGRANPWLVVQEKAQRALVALSARLRVCPQSRFDRLKAGTASRKRGPAGVEAMRAAYEQGES
ncbi:phage terminase small subunit [Lysobacter niastensis]|uniref:Phage terminase small subunit n=1 Tax=Lysobacter niastensis TaxID=380629 RepID=A0ABU1WEY6_9GAMM|nr:P27 family phage terminase small subunit [Lysobacter niastensis]MDR7136167.1 phage terminase small subunit [Lysobacter niastensis]